MELKDKLQRFLDAQKRDYQTALSEIENGKKRSHWMWYIFPQVDGLGFSETSRFYAIKDLEEAEAFLNQPVLGRRLTEICEALLQQKSNNANQIFGSPDDVKLKSSMTLFAAVPNANMVFQAVLKKFFGGTKDMQTLRIIQK